MLATALNLLETLVKAPLKDLKMYDIKDYIIITELYEDPEILSEGPVYKATCAELPGAADFGCTAEEAENLMLESIQLTQEAFEKDGLEFPRPLKFR